MKNMKTKLVDLLIKEATHKMSSFQQNSGQFLSDNNGWAMTNQDLIWPFALLYNKEHSRNSLYRSKKLLEIVKKGGNAILNVQDRDGKVPFIKDDGSSWGMIYMPWTMFHWLEAYSAVNGSLDRRTGESWKQGLYKAYAGIYRELKKASVHNIPAWNAMALFKAGKIFNKPVWENFASAFIRRVADSMHYDGFWEEGGGPTTSYNLLYIHALGLYYHESRDTHVLDALEKAADFHKSFTYPDGTLAETVDGRVKYRNSINAAGIPGFLCVKNGRAFADFILKKLAERKNRGRHLPHLASIINIYPEDTAPQENLIQTSENYCGLFENRAAILRKNGYYICLSGYVNKTDDYIKNTENRWIQDRTSFISVWHDSCGQIIGGGNSKAQPLWANFTVWKNTWCAWCPHAARVSHKDSALSVLLDYGQAECSIRAYMTKYKNVKIVLKAHSFKQGISRILSSLLLNLTGEVRTKDCRFTADPDSSKTLHIKRSQSLETGQWILTLRNKKAVLFWPEYPFNPYAIDGKSPPEYSRARLSFTLSPDSPEAEITIKIKNGPYS